VPRGVNPDGLERCPGYGALHVNAIDGTVRVAQGMNIVNRFEHQREIAPLVDTLNLLHEMAPLVGASFGESPLDHTRGHARYSLKAVPRVTIDARGRTTRGFQYTVNFAEMPVTGRGRFAPAAVLLKPGPPSFAIAVARCVSIMLARLIDSFGFRLNTCF
jgi:hypothetical protein